MYSGEDQRKMRLDTVLPQDDILAHELEWLREFTPATNEEPPVAELRNRVVAAPRPHVERCDMDGGAMFNLAAGQGDPYDTFGLVTVLMFEATGFLATGGTSYLPGFTCCQRT